MPYSFIYVLQDATKSLGSKWLDMMLVGQRKTMLVQMNDVYRLRNYQCFQGIGVGLLFPLK